MPTGAWKGGGQALPFGCVANLELPTIERFLWKSLQPGEYVMLDQHRIQQVLCALLDEGCISREGFEPVGSYLTGPAGIDPLKRVQLAARIAHRFLEYEYNRPGVWREEGRWEPAGIDGTWMKGKSYVPPGSLDEPWQAELYRLMRRCFAAAPRSGDANAAAYLTLPQLYRLRREEVTPAGAPLPMQPAIVFMFGVTKVSHFHRNILVEISQIDNVDLQVYLTNPCAEFWEDVNTTRSNVRRIWSSTTNGAAISPRRHDDYDKEELHLLAGAAPTADHHHLELWGDAGKENIFLWCQDAQWNFDYRSPEWVDNEMKPAHCSNRFSIRCCGVRRN
ncbi:MAG: exodeoxyribonuclease V subunit gamma [Chitinispirillaceae bacterium]|nr:exodeoxyribonuclease V subunit gamma [Chitinispirillaceae bacterium]